jgi:hypothetical protein
MTPPAMRIDGAAGRPPWQLEHRPADQREAIVARLEDAGVTPAQLSAALADGGDALYAASRAGGTADAFGGDLAVALLAAEVSALAAHLNSRASAVRAKAVDALLDDYSAVAVASALGVSRQKVYDISKGGSVAAFLDISPWGQL